MDEVKKGFFSTKGGKIALFLIVLCLGIFLGGFYVSVDSGKELSQYVLLQQEMDLEKSEALTWEAYSSESPQVAVWAISNRLNLIEETYSVRPGKDKVYYYISFVGHGRLARLFRDAHDTNAETPHLSLAVNLMKSWSVEAKPDVEEVFKTLEKIDQKEAQSRAGDNNTNKLAR